MYRVLAVLALAGGLIFTAHGASAQSFTRLTDTDLPGHDFSGKWNAPQTTLNQCEYLCKYDDECRSYSWVTWNRTCWLKHGAGRREYSPGIQSGIKLDNEE